ncbi:MAG: hypothetical protein AAB910_01260 [Patescibacteria group bacterium]
MKFARLLVAVFVVVMGFTACSSPTGPSYPRIVILEPQDQAKLKIGSTVTIRWECQNCETVQARLATVTLSREGSDSNTHWIVAEVLTGFLSDSRQWTVGRYELVYEPGGPYPGFYYLNIHSHSVDSTNVFEVSSQRSVLVELVR